MDLPIPAARNGPEIANPAAPNPEAPNPAGENADGANQAGENPAARENAGPRVAIGAAPQDVVDEAPDDGEQGDDGMLGTENPIGAPEEGVPNRGNGLEHGRNPVLTPREAAAAAAIRRAAASEVREAGDTVADDTGRILRHAEEDRTHGMRETRETVEDDRRGDGEHGTSGSEGGVEDVRAQIPAHPTSQVGPDPRPVGPNIQDSDPVGPIMPDANPDGLVIPDVDLDERVVPDLHPVAEVVVGLNPVDRDVPEPPPPAPNDGDGGDADGRGDGQGERNRGDVAGDGEQDGGARNVGWGRGVQFGVGGRIRATMASVAAVTCLVMFPSVMFLGPLLSGEVSVLRTLLLFAVLILRGL